MRQQPEPDFEFDVPPDADELGFCATYNGVRSLSLSMLLEFVLGCVRRPGDRQLVITDVTFHRAATIQAPSRLCLTLDPVSNSIEVLQRFEGAESGLLVLLASLDEPRASRQTRDMPLQSPVDSRADAYATLARLGYDYDPAFRVLQNLQLDPTSAWADLTGHLNGLEPRETGFLFPPTMLEAGIQLGRLLASVDENAIPVWPASIGTLSVERPIDAMTQRAVAYWEDGPAGTRSISVSYLGPGGRIDAVIRNLRFTPVASTAQRGSDVFAEQPHQFALVRHALARTVGVRPRSIAGEMTLGEIGIDSIRALRAQVHIQRAFGLHLPLTALRPEISIESAAQALAAISLPPVRPAAVSARTFPLLPLQQAYWLGRAAEGAPSHVYMELTLPELDTSRLQDALNALVRAHASLRLVIRDGLTQEVLEDPPAYEVSEHDLSYVDDATAEEHVQALRAEWSHRARDPRVWPLFDVGVSRLPSQVLVRVSVDLLTLDIASIRLLASQCVALYRQPRRTLGTARLSFVDFVHHLYGSLRSSAKYDADRAYWEARLPNLPGPPALPRRHGTTAGPQRYERSSLHIEGHQLEALNRNAEAEKLTVASIICAAYALVLSRWGGGNRFSIVSTLSNRGWLGADSSRVTGAYTAALPLEIELRDETLGACARELQHRLWTDLEHSSYASADLLRQLHRMDGSWLSGYPVFTGLVGFDDGLPELPASWLESLRFGVSQTPGVSIDCQAIGAQGMLVVQWDAAVDAFPPELVQTMFAAFQRLLQTACQPGGLHRAVELLPPEQRARRSLVNATSCSVPDVDLTALFERTAATTPDAVAVIDRDGAVTYGELAASASEVAARLMAAGIQAQELVPIVLDKGWRQVAAVLGILRTGAAYVPIASDTPWMRAERILREVNAKLVVTTREQASGVPWLRGIATLAIDTEPAQTNTALGPRTVDPGRLAYVLFTSGSTGEPKGVMIEHRSLVNRILDVNQRFHVTREDRVLSLTALEHDMSAYDIFGMAACAGTVVYPDPALLLDPAHWLELMRTHRVSLWNSVPAFMGMLLEHMEGARPEPPSALRHVLLSGDWIPVPYAARIGALLPGAQLTSLGGATETAIWDIGHTVDASPVATSSVPYGKPMANAAYFIFDEGLRQCPDFVIGELHAAGHGLARGYLNDPVRTAQRFIVHPELGERLYRTGDLGRYLPDGNIELIGRKDAQVKIRGHRVEIEEVEAVLQSHPAVREAAVVAVGSRGNQRLVGFIVPRDPVPDIDGLLHYARERLPDESVPNPLTPLDEMPLTANGKVDRSALRALGGAYRQVSGRSNDPRTRRVAELVQMALGIDAIGDDDNLFAAGATSIDVVRLDQRLRDALGTSPGITRIFSAPTIAGIAAALNGLCPAAPRVQPDERIRLFCLPWAGGIAQQCFSRWTQLLPRGIRSVAMEYPGHGERLAEPCERAMSELVDDLLQRLGDDLRQPFALFGHSMGALVALELTLTLMRRGERLPERLYVAACGAPTRPGRIAGEKGALYQRLLADAQPMPSSDEERELRAAFERATQADLELLAAYEAGQATRLAVPLVSIVGREDPFVTREDAERWGLWSTDFDLQIVPGDHFLQAASKELSELIGRRP